MVVRKFAIPLIVIFCAGVAVSSFAAGEFGTVTEDSPAPDLTSLTAQVESLTAQQSDQKKAFFRKVYSQLSATLNQSGAAGNYVLERFKDERFNERNGGNAAATKWKRDNAKLFSDRTIEQAAKLHMDYLLLTIKRACEDSAKPIQKDVMSYLNELYQSADLIAGSTRDPVEVKFNVYDEKEGKVVGQMVGQLDGSGQQDRMREDPRQYVMQLLNDPVTDGTIAKSLGVQGQFGDLDGWEKSAANFSGILEGDVRPVLRKDKDPSLLGTWDYEINFRKLMAGKNPNQRSEVEFESIDMPRLLWRKAKDTELIGMPNRALQMRIDIAKAYPAHPDFDGWMNEINTEIEVLKNKQPAAAPQAVDGGGVPLTPEPSPAT